MRKENTYIKVDLNTGDLLGREVQALYRTMKDMKGIYQDEESRKILDENTVVYRVEVYRPVTEGREGGLFWGTTFLNPGMVGDEYFMTKGHFHAKPTRSEFYLTVAGEGALILMDDQRKTVFEHMSPGTLHYVPAWTAHRIANTGSSLLSVLACWPSDAGHDYETIAQNGFSARLRNIGGSPVLVEDP